MKKIVKLTLLLVLTTSFLSFNNNLTDYYSLTVKVKDLRNSKGTLQFTLYNKDGTIPDEEYTQYYKKLNSEIENGSASVTFEKIPKGTYAINILHDEDRNGKIKKGWVMPVEGIGFSNFTSIGFSNRPNFKKASFNVHSNMTKTVKIIYL